MGPLWMNTIILGVITVHFSATAPTTCHRSLILVYATMVSRRGVRVRGDETVGATPLATPVSVIIWANSVGGASFRQTDSTSWTVCAMKRQKICLLSTCVKIWYAVLIQQLAPLMTSQSFQITTYIILGHMGTLTMSYKTINHVCSPVWVFFGGKNPHKLVKLLE